MDLLRADARHFFLNGVRFTFGIWLFYAGFMKLFVMGPDAFVGFITAEFDKTWSPHALNIALAWLIMLAEPVLALLILRGRSMRKVWTATAMLMFLLVLGQTLLMKPEVIANWQYFILTLVCAALSDPEK